MIADGLTKILPRQKHLEFVRMLGMEDIGHLLKDLNEDQWVLLASFMDSPCWEGVSTKSGHSRTNPMRFLLSINQPSVEWQCMHTGDNDNASMPNLFLLSLLSFGHLGFVTSENPRSTVSSWVFQPPWAPRFMFQSINQSQSFNQSLLLIPLPWISRSSRYSVAAILLTVISPIAYWWIGCT